MTSSASAIYRSAFTGEELRPKGQSTTSWPASRPACRSDSQAADSPLGLSAVLAHPPQYGGRLRRRMGTASLDLGLKAEACA
ncbi:hypothetical protein ACFOEY_05135 [Paracandidimonas soli]|uniref:hypothetical protein n=1 Tax=Paracandidimonas soli TaxID=1917182 RepID=UPI0036177196